MSSLLSRAANWFVRTFLPGQLLKPRYGQRRALNAFLPSGISWGPYSQFWQSDRYEQVRHFRHWVYVAVDKIATEVAMHQPNVSFIRDAREEDPSSPAGKSWAARKHLSPSLSCLLPERKALTPLLSHELLEPAPQSHPLVRLLSDPNEPDTSYDLWYETTMYLSLTGIAYWWLPPNPYSMKPAAAWVLPSHWIWPYYSKAGNIEQYHVRPIEGNYIQASIPAEDVIVFRCKSPVSKVDGYSTLTAAGQWVDSEESVSRARWHSYRNGIFPGVSIEFDAEAKLPDALDLDRIEARLMQRYGGEANANRPMFVPPGAKVKKLTLTPEELGCFESEEQLRDMILAAFHVPPASVGVVRNMTYGSVQASSVGLYTGAINPKFRYYGQNLTEKLAQPRYDKQLRVWWEDRTPQDPDLLEKQLMTDLAVGSVTPNEVRSLRGREAYPDDYHGDEPWRPLNTRPVSIILAQSAFPSAAGGGAGFAGGDGTQPSSPAVGSNPDAGSGPSGGIPGDEDGEGQGSPGMSPSSVSDPQNSPRLHDDNLHVN